MQTKVVPDGWDPEGPRPFTYHPPVSDHELDALNADKIKQYLATAYPKGDVGMKKLVQELIVEPKEKEKQEAKARKEFLANAYKPKLKGVGDQQWRKEVPKVQTTLFAPNTWQRTFIYKKYFAIKVFFVEKKYISFFNSVQTMVNKDFLKEKFTLVIKTILSLRKAVTINRRHNVPDGEIMKNYFNSNR